MITGTYNAKQFHFKAYTHLSLLDNALKYLKEANATKSQISILGKVSQFYLNQNKEVLKNTDALKLHWRKVLGENTNFGSFNNPELGTIFIVGALATTFLYEVDGKTLGMLSSGPYGILRGIGESESQTTSHLKTLNNGNYLLIYRGTQTDLRNYKRILEENENR